MKSPIKQFGLKVMRSDFTKRVPKEVISLPSKLINFHKKRKVDLVFLKEVKEITALFRTEGFPERIINNIPKLIRRVDRIKPILDRLADNGLH
ncbi:hypothetical protein ES705_18233 [subsurface metagenome]